MNEPQHNLAQHNPEERKPIGEGLATRCTGVAGQVGTIVPRYDLIFNNDVGCRRLAETYGEGAIKYGPHNWKSGMPESNLLNHGLAHIRMHIAGDKTEDHLAHAVWNFFTLMFMQERRPDLMDITGGAVIDKK